MDTLEVNLQTKSVYDHDKDGRPDILDADDDGDGIPSVYEGVGDADQDGLANYLDTDSDGDGVPDKDEVVFSLEDADSDRIDDRFDADIHAGADENGDGILDQLVFADSNNNKVPDFLDKSVRGLSSTAKTQFTHIAKTTEAKSTSPDTPTGKSKAIADKLKSIAVVKPAKTTKPFKKAKPILSEEDSDGDGLSNSIELALGLNPSHVDSDSDGLNDLLEVGVNPKVPQDSDLDGFIDAIDPDDDNDGIPTKLEIQVSKSLNYKLDTDNDGVFNYQDANDDGDTRLTKLEGLVADNDKDGIPDYLDDRDGVSKPSQAKIVILYDKSTESKRQSADMPSLKTGTAINVVTSD